jgi:hypothetical protein
MKHLDSSTSPTASSASPAPTYPSASTGSSAGTGPNTSARPARKSPYAVSIIGTAVYDGFVCLQYAVAPVPPALVGNKSLHEGDNAGVAIDSRHRIYRHCRSAYRVSRDGKRAVGVLKVGPTSWPTLGVVRILFAPFAYSAGLDRELCEVRLSFDGGQVRTSSEG